MANLLWLQGGACSGNAMSLLNAEQPSVCDLVTDFGITILWHPSLGLELGDNLRNLLGSLTRGDVALDILVFEGTVIQAPEGTGTWNRFAGRPMKDWVTELARVLGDTVLRLRHLRELHKLGKLAPSALYDDEGADFEPPGVRILGGDLPRARAFDIYVAPRPALPGDPLPQRERERARPAPAFLSPSGRRSGRG